MKSIDKVASTPVFEDCKRGEIERGLKTFWDKRQGNTKSNRRKTWKWITKFDDSKNENNR